MQMLFNRLFHSNRISSIDKEGYLSAEQLLLEEYTAGEVAQLLQFFHSAGKQALSTILLHLLTDFFSICRCFDWIWSSQWPRSNPLFASCLLFSLSERTPAVVRR
jgi:hypothetical protein